MPRGCFLLARHFCCPALKFSLLLLKLMSQWHFCFCWCRASPGLIFVILFFSPELNCCFYFLFYFAQVDCFQLPGMFLLPQHGCFCCHDVVLLTSVGTGWLLLFSLAAAVACGVVMGTPGPPGWKHQDLLGGSVMWEKWGSFFLLTSLLLFWFLCLYLGSHTGGLLFCSLSGATLKLLFLFSFFSCSGWLFPLATYQIVAIRPDPFQSLGTISESRAAVSKSICAGRFICWFSFFAALWLIFVFFFSFFSRNISGAGSIRIGRRGRLIVVFVLCFGSFAQVGW